MKIANVALNGMNKYEARLCDWLRDRCLDRHRRPDIVTLQKIGSSGPFPKKKLRNIGYESWFLDHKRHYRGVAILAHYDFLSRHNRPPPEELVRELPDDDRNESRFLTVSIGNLWVSSVYAPPSDGSSVAPTVDWLKRLRGHVDDRGYARQNSVLCGDFNVTAIDKRKGKLQRTLEELKDLGFCDLYRKAHPDPEEKPGYTRHCGKRYPSRLHLILASTSVREGLRSACTDPEVRSWPRKDAPPLVVDLDNIFLHKPKTPTDRIP